MLLVNRENSRMSKPLHNIYNSQLSKINEYFRSCVNWDFPQFRCFPLYPLSSKFINISDTLLLKTVSLHSFFVYPLILKFLFKRWLKHKCKAQVGTYRLVVFFLCVNFRQLSNPSLEPFHVKGPRKKVHIEKWIF